MRDIADYLSILTCDFAWLFPRAIRFVTTVTPFDIIQCLTTAMPDTVRSNGDIIAKLLISARLPYAFTGAKRSIFDDALLRAEAFWRAMENAISTPIAGRADFASFGSWLLHALLAFNRYIVCTKLTQTLITLPRRMLLKCRRHSTALHADCAFYLLIFSLIAGRCV